MEAIAMTEMERVMGRLPKHALAWIAQQKANGVDLAFKNEPYYSRVRLEPDSLTADGSNNTTTVFNQGKTVQAFTYGIGGTMTPAGFVATGTGYGLGTIADTNLITTTGKVTNGGDLVVVDGIAILPTPKTDPVLLKALIAEISITAGFGGNVNDYKLGTPLIWPGGGGLFGASSSLLAPGNLGDAKGIVPGTLNNGLPGAADIRWFSDPIVWMPQSSGGDSIFAMSLKVERAVTVIANARVGAAGVAAVTPPITAGAEGTYVEFNVFLYGNQFGPRSRNR